MITKKGKWKRLITGEKGKMWNLCAHERELLKNYENKGIRKLHDNLDDDKREQVKESGRIKKEMLDNLDENKREELKNVDRKRKKEKWQPWYLWKGIVKKLWKKDNWKDNLDDGKGEQTKQNDKTKKETCDYLDDNKREQVRYNDKNKSIVGPPSHPPLLKGGGRTFQKLNHLGGAWNFMLERGDKPEKGGLM